MKPIELRRGPEGLNRLDRIRKADQLVYRARWIAAGVTDYRVLSEIGIEVYCLYLAQAAGFYRAAGLGTLADRVDAIRQKNPDVAWIHFDHGNANADF